MAARRPASGSALSAGMGMKAALLLCLLLASSVGDAGAARPMPSFLDGMGVPEAPRRANLDVSQDKGSAHLELNTSNPQTVRADPKAKAALALTNGAMTDGELLRFWALILCVYGSVMCIVLTLWKFLSYFDTENDFSDASEMKPGSIISDPTADENQDRLASRLRLSWYSIRFKDKLLQMQWHQYQEESKQMAACARVLSYVFFSMCFYEVIQTVQSHHRMSRNVSVHLAMLAIYVALIFVTARCSRAPSPMLFWPSLFALFFFIPASSLPPFTPSCENLAWLAKEGSTSESDLCLDEEIRHVDCSPQGHTAIQMIMTWLLLQPWVLPSLEHMHMVWFWVLLVYPGMNMVTFQWQGNKVFDELDCLYRVFLLSITFFISIVKKFALEKSRRNKFVQCLQQKASSVKIFHILEYMMPVHVIGPMLTDPKAPIADQVKRVSILFILIDDFDQFTRRMLPSELLRFLNDQFTRFDDICMANKVTKIETVGEEYVAAVGVLPRDVEDNHRFGHGPLLERLFVAAGQIMQLQTEEVKFKMGIHTGSIVAGVIGTKLPRYRLFGDTINSAARMMQKGIPGQLQFGAGTHSDLSEHLRDQVHYRGEVEMKGKGKVQAWTFDGSSVDSLPLPALRRDRTDSGRTRKRASIAETAALDAATFVGDSWVERNTDKQFEETLQKMQEAATQKSRKRWFLSEKEGFTAELERRWFEWFHQTVICHKIVRRFGTEAILCLCLSGFEFWYMMDMQNTQAWRHHPFYSGTQRMAVFVYSRGWVLLVCMIFWYFAEATKWIQNHPGQSQALILLSTCAAIFWVYLSYDALVFSNSDVYRKETDFRNFYVAPDDEVYTLNFVLFFFLLMRKHALLFYPSLVLLPLAILVIMAPNFYNTYIHFSPRSTDTDYIESIFSVQGEFLFLLQVVITLIIAHEDEQASRARFKARHTVQETQKRTEDILNTLMPPLVVRALRALPPNEPMPTDTYRHATIAQSDLCGFTQLASSCRPTEVVKFMGDLFGAFDLLTDKHGVYKVETVGDAYIAGMAEQPLTKVNSPYSVILFGLDMVRAVDDWAAAMRVNVTCRVGVAYGECIGGIVGTDMQRYHLFGDLLTCMDILEATSTEGRVQISTPCKLEVERQLREEMGETRPEVLRFIQREEPHLKTSKGEIHEYSEVGGPAYLVMSSQPLRNRQGVTVF